MVEEALQRIESLLKTDFAVSKRFLAVLLLEEDEEMRQWVEARDPGVTEKVTAIVNDFKKKAPDPIEYGLALRNQAKASAVYSKVVKIRKEHHKASQVLDRYLMHPIVGSLILFLILYWGFYQFVGVLGAGIVVDFIEDTIFGRFLNPIATALTQKIIPWVWLQDLFVGEYGVVTLGLRYAVALILPIVTFFFVLFSIIEDTGYLPRLAMLMDRIFKRIGLSGRAVIPMVLGLGCVTMATLVTRTLPTKRERIIATFLMSLAIPCSAQLGVILALLAARPRALLLWGIIILAVFLVVGVLTARILPGVRPSFYMELPLLRLPNVHNVFVKTYTRVKWYFVEVLPLFLLASVLIWLGELTKVLDKIVGVLKHPVQWIGMPPEAARAFLFGFFRRDYGAAGLYDLHKAGGLDGRQLVVACVALTLFIPCIAQFLINIKERGWKMGLALSVFILIFSFGIAFGVNGFLSAVGWTL